MSNTQDEGTVVEAVELSIRKHQPMEPLQANQRTNGVPSSSSSIPESFYVHQQQQATVDEIAEEEDKATQDYISFFNRTAACSAHDGGGDSDGDDVSISEEDGRVIDAFKVDLDCRAVSHNTLGDD